jgi:hypothetical protein
VSTEDDAGFGREWNMNRSTPDRDFNGLRPNTGRDKAAAPEISAERGRCWPVRADEWSIRPGAGRR